MPKKQKKEPKKRNLLYNHPLLRKCGKHEKSKKTKRDLQNEERND